MSGAGIAELTSQRRQELPRQCGHFAQENLEYAMTEPGEEQGRDSAHRHCPWRRIEQRELAEVRAGGQLIDLAPLANDGGAPLEHHEERLAFLAFAYDVRALGGLDYLDMARDNAQIASRAASELRNRAKALDSRSP